MESKDLNILTDESIVKMAQEGSSTAYEYLIEKYREVAKNKAKIYFIAGADRDDVIQEGMIGIFKAIRDFDPEKEASFHTFAELCINRQIINAIKAANREKHQILNDSVSLSHSDDGSDVDFLWKGSAHNTEFNPESLMLIKEITEYLKAEGNHIFSPFEKEVWEELLKGRSAKEIALKCNKPVKSIDNAVQRIKRKIHRFIVE